MYHLAAYSYALGVGTDLDATALSDDILSVQNNHFVLSRPMDLIGVIAFSPLLTQIKLASPSMRQIAAPYVRPIFNGTTPPSNYNIQLLDDQPFRLQAFEEIQAIATSSIGASTERLCVGIFLQDSMEPVPPGNVTPLRFTSTTAAVANAWQTLTLTWADTLPSGRYAIVMTEHYSATAQLHRWIISNQVFRPGLPSFTTAIMRHPYAIDKGQWGVLGRFNSNDLPRLQVLCTATDATHVGYLSVVRIGNL